MVSNLLFGRSPGASSLHGFTESACSSDKKQNGTGSIDPTRAVYTDHFVFFSYPAVQDEKEHDVLDYSSGTRSSCGGSEHRAQGS